MADGISSISSVRFWPSICFEDGSRLLKTKLCPLACLTCCYKMGLSRDMLRGFLCKMQTWVRLIPRQEISLTCAKGFYGIHTIFPCPSSSSHFPSCVASWIGCPESGHIFSILCCVSWDRLFPASAERSL
jgi:hypothetical protein